MYSQLLIGWKMAPSNHSYRLSLWESAIIILVLLVNIGEGESQIA